MRMTGFGEPQPQARNFVDLFTRFRVQGYRKCRVFGGVIGVWAVQDFWGVLTFQGSGFAEFSAFGVCGV